MSVKQRILKECFVHADNVSYLNHYLKQALHMCDSYIPQGTQYNSMIHFTQEVMELNTLRTYKLYCIIVWIIVLPQFASYMRQYDNPEQFDRFYSILDAEFANFLIGRKPDGTLFDKDGSAEALNQRSVGYFVDRMRQHYMYEEPIPTITLPSSNANVQRAQSLALPPPHGSTAKKRV
jgi:hypothetical protein